jgi:tripartite-type tricarboxylate transporter receptor subunit TctC
MRRWGQTAWVAAVVLSCVVLAPAAHSQIAGGGTITIVVPIGAGGGVDATGRLIAEKLQQRLKQNVVVENRVGGGGTVGTDSVAKAAPDGRTLLLMEMGASLQKWLHKNVPFDVVKDFAPIAQVATAPLLLFAQSSFKANNAKELLAMAKANPGKISVGTPGIGSPHHLAMTMMNALGKVDIVPVPYRGAALSLNDMLAGQIPMIWAAPTSVMPHVKAGKVKILGIASPQRDPEFPDVPTMAESGIKGFSLVIWFGLAAPAKTPPALVERLTKEVHDIAALPDVQARMHKVGLSPAYADNKAFAEIIRSDHERFGKIIQAAGIVPK